MHRIGQPCDWTVVLGSLHLDGLGTIRNGIKPEDKTGSVFQVAIPF